MMVCRYMIRELQRRLGRLWSYTGRQWRSTVHALEFQRHLDSDLLIEIIVGAFLGLQIITNKIMWWILV
ncbi:MAG: hypothetical protein CMK32_01105 [Porticoccaceae bacterium]|nr:hypothetical protein [Porticoccaceae bacterium]